MIITNIREFKAGWMIGDFEPAILKTKAFDFAHHKYPKGFQGTNHKHMRSEEYNYIVKGTVNVNGTVLTDGDMFLFEIGEYCGSVSYMEDTDLIIIKTPTGKNDKVDADGADMPMPK